MNQKLLQKDVQEFIADFDGDISRLALKGSPFEEVDTKELLEQLESRQKAEKKLPTWFYAEGIYWPPKVSIEQTSSEETAAYKASLINGKTLADLTGGFGVDTFYFAKRFATVVYFEKNEALANIAEHNFNRLGLTNIQVEPKNGVYGIQNQSFDWLYIDPSRRSDTKGKVFLLEDCEPNIIEGLPSLFESSPNIMVKTSPMLDISIGLEAMQNVREIHVVAVNNEVKELLWILSKDFNEKPKVVTKNLRENRNETYSFFWDETVEAVYGEPSRFLYEPNAAIMKSGAFQLLTKSFKVKKLHEHSHLYTSDVLREFPGRIFSVEQVLPYSKKSIRESNFSKANITTRNFPESVAQLRKKWKISDGGELYLFFTTLLNDKKIVLVCKKIDSGR
ncbi:THUMP-like domain-containing protein [Luteirhabdus pelagi]|uniref:THUMP-like domain-containing protein n=1 Tax=Luteirhabdus pelagi TaxID=2792783 RepID=UPI00193947A2|nr:class I SAM-dependent methyltransferase [Luteirhabdus pelagi]